MEQVRSWFEPVKPDPGTPIYDALKRELDGSKEEEDR